MSISPYLNFAGNCREAVEFYADVFQTQKPQMMTFGEMPGGDPSQPMPEAVKNMILNALIVIDGTPVMFSDSPPGMGPQLNPGNNVSLTLVTKDRELIQRAYDRLKEGGAVHMELQETFWSKLYGNLRDRFGIEWQLSLDSGESYSQSFS